MKNIKLSFKQNSSKYEELNEAYQCSFSYPHIAIKYLKKDEKINSNTIQYYDRNKDEHCEIFNEIDFSKAFKPAYVYDPFLKIFALIDNNDIVILNFSDKIKSFTQDQLKISILESLVIKIRYYKLFQNIVTLLMRLGQDLIVPYLKENRSYIIFKDKIIDEHRLKNLFLKKRLLIRSVNIPIDINVYTSKLEYVDSKSSLILSKNVITPMSRILIKQNVIFNRYRIDENFKKNRFKSILLENISYVELASKFIEQNDSIINEMFNSLYGTTSTTYRATINNESQFKLLKLMISCYYEYVNNNYNKDNIEYNATQIKKYLRFNAGFPKQFPALVNHSLHKSRLTNYTDIKINNFKLRYYHGSKYHYGDRRSKEDQSIIDSINKVSCYKKINSIRIDSEDVDTFNFKLYIIILSKFKDFKLIFEQIEEYNRNILIEQMKNI